MQHSGFHATIFTTRSTGGMFPLLCPKVEDRDRDENKLENQIKKSLFQNHDTTMFEARILQGSVIKKIIEAIRELVTDANLDCNEEQGISMQVSKFDS